MLAQADIPGRRHGDDLCHDARGYSRGQFAIGCRSGSPTCQDEPAWMPCGCSTACPLDCPDTCSLEVDGGGRPPRLDRRRPREPPDAGVHLRQGEAARAARVRARAGDDAVGAHRAEGSGEFRAASWEEALDLVASRISAAIGESTARRRSFPTSTTRPRVCWPPRASHGVCSTSSARRESSTRSARRPPARRGNRRSGRCCRPTRTTSCTAGSSSSGARTRRSRTSTSRRSCSGLGLRARGSWSSIRGARRWRGAPIGIWRCGRAPTWRSCSGSCGTSRRTISSTVRSSMRTRLVRIELIAAAASWGLGRTADVTGVAGRRHRRVRRGARVDPPRVHPHRMGTRAEPQRWLVVPVGARAAVLTGPARRARRGDHVEPQRSRRLLAGRTRRKGASQGQHERARRPTAAGEEIRVLFVQGSNPAVTVPQSAARARGLGPRRRVHGRARPGAHGHRALRGRRASRDDALRGRGPRRVIRLVHAPAGRRGDRSGRREPHERRGRCGARGAARSRQARGSTPIPMR